MPFAEDVLAAREKIEASFVGQVTQGQQSRALPSGTLACGQFLDAHEHTQRGLFGTAAAIHVLSGRRNDRAVDGVLSSLVEYARRRTEIERAIGKIEQAKLSRDDSNILKQSELLASLSDVPHSINGIDSVVQEIAARLLQAGEQSGRWGYFTDSMDHDLLPTAFAFAALCRAGYGARLDETVKYLHDALSRRATDAQSVITALYAIVRARAIDRFPLGELRQALVRATSVLHSQLREPIEQNVEYWDGERSHYFRIPWQLYYIYVDNSIAPWYAFPNSRASALLRDATAAARSDGFFYPYSGRRISSRTSAVLHEVIGARAEPRQLLRRAAEVAARLGQLAPAMRVAVRASAIGVAALSFVAYFVARESWLASLAPGILTSLVAAVALWAAR